MDVQYQNYGMWKAYGLVYHLLDNGVPIHWAISQSKGWNGVDFTTSGTDLRTFATVSNWGYKGGPFLIDAADAPAAIPLIQAWWTKHANQPSVHQVTEGFTARVDIILHKPPRIANEAINAGISIAYYNAAGIPDMNGNTWSASSPNILDQTEIANNAFFSSGVCTEMNFDVFVTPHNDGYEYSLTDPGNLGTRTYAMLDNFVMMGGGWIALCHSILSNENAIADLYLNSSPPVRALFSSPAGGAGGFLMKYGMPEKANIGGTYTVNLPNLPIAQAVSTSVLQELPGGSVQTWDKDIVTYWGQTERVAYFASGGKQYDHVINGVGHNGTGAGKMTCLGGHSYSTSLPYSGNSEAPYLRFFYNALFFNGAAVARLALVPDSRQVPQLTNYPVNLLLMNTGASTASDNINIQITLPAGVIYNSTSGPAPTLTGGGAFPTVLSWTSLPDLSSNSTALTVNITVSFPDLGNHKVADFHASYGDVFAENFTLNSCHTIEVTPVPVPVIAKTPSTQGPLYRGQTASWALTFSNTGDGILYNGMVEDILPAGFTFKSAIPSPASVVPLPGGTTRIRWNVGTLTAHSSDQTITLQVYAGGTPGSYTNYGTLGGRDSNGNSFSDTSNGADVTIQEPDIDLNKSVNMTEADITTPGATLSYTIRPLYEGNSLLSNVIIADPVPAYTSYIGSSANAGGTYGFTPLSAIDATDPLVGTTSIISVTPALLKAGGTVDVVMRLTNASGSSITDIVPSVRDARVGTVWTAPAVVSLANGNSVDIAFTGCQLDETGEMRFNGEAYGLIGTEEVVFPTAQSGSVLITSELNATPSGDIVTWHLGSNNAGIPGEEISSGWTPAVYGLQGDGKTGFSRYGINSNAWTNKPVTPWAVKAGGALAANGNGLIYALRGNNTQDYSVFNLSPNQNNWTSLQVTGTNVKEGGALTYLGGYVFALMGDGKMFKRYDPAGNTWSALAPTPENIKKGGALTTDGTYIFALRGDGKNNFYRYTTDPNPANPGSWTARASLPVNVDWGGSLTCLGGYIYALQGGGKKGFYRYDITANTWSKMKDTPGNVADGGSLTNDGTYIYAFQGKSLNYWRYDIAGNTWSAMASANFTGIVGQGGALVYDPGKNPKGLYSNMRADRSLVSTDDMITLTLELRNEENQSKTITPSAVAVTATNGATATLNSGPVPATLTLAPGASGTFTWIYMATAGSSPGSLTFSANARYPNNKYFPAATSRSVIVTPPLTYQVRIFDANDVPPTVNQISNLAMVSDQSAFSLGVNSNLANTTLRRPNLSVTKSNAPEGTVEPGDLITYTISVKNDGTGQATGVMVTDAVPSFTTYIAGSCSGGSSCEPDGNGNIVWDVGNVPAFTATTLTFRVSAQTGLAIGTYTITNTATATSANAESPNSNTVTNHLLVEPELTIVKSQRSNSLKDAELIVEPGNTITYSFLVSNVSPFVTATGIVVADAIPSHTTYYAGSCTGGISCGPDGTGNIMWNAGSLAAGNSITLTVQLTVDNPNTNGATVVNHAILSANGLTPISSNYVSYTIEAAPDLEVSKSSVPISGSTVEPGDVITYTITVSNSGNANTDEASLHDAIPAGTSYVTGSTSINGLSVSDTSTGGSRLEEGIDLFSPGMGEPENGGTLAVGHPASVNFSVIVTDNFAIGYTITNTAHAGAPGILPVTSNMTEHLLKVDYGDAPDPVYPTLMASDGARHIVKTGIFMGMTPPDPENDGQPSPDAGANPLPGNGDDGTTSDDEDGVAFPSSFIPGQTQTISVRVTGTGGKLSAWIDWNADGDWADGGEQIAADVTDGGAGDNDPTPGMILLSVGVPANLTSSATFARFRWATRSGLFFTGSAPNGEVEDYQVRLTPAADLALTKNASPNPLIAGQLLTFTLTVTNTGPADAEDVIITDDPLPAGLSNIQHSLDQGLTWMDGWTGSHTLASLSGSAPGNTFELLIRGITSIWLCGTFGNTATISATTSDSNLTDNSTTVTVTLTNTAPITADDVYTMIQNTDAFPSSHTGSVLGNDYDPENQYLVVNSWGTPSAGGILAGNQNGFFTYTPPTGYTGIVTFTYQVCDSCGVCVQGNVTVNVMPCMDTPAVPESILRN